MEGRNFSKSFNDSTSVILNETTVSKIGWKSALGKYIVYPGNKDQRFKVIGVVKDFNNESLHEEVMPFALFHNTSKTYSTPNTYIVTRVDSKI